MPNFGNDIFTGYASIASSPNIIFGSPGTNIGLPALSGFLVSSSVYFQDNLSLGPFDLHLGVYTDSPGRPNVLIGETVCVSVPLGFLGWLTIPHTSLAPITAGVPYWTVMSHNASGNILMWVRSGGSRCYGIGNTCPNPFPNPYPSGGSIDAYEYAIYSTYTLTGPSGDTGPWGTCRCDPTAI